MIIFVLFLNIYYFRLPNFSGLKTIRAMKSTQRFIRENEEFVESSQRAQYASFAGSQWLEFKLQMLGCAVVTGK